MVKASHCFIGAAIVLGVFNLSRAVAADHTVEIEGMVFKPANLSVKKGDTVTWTNKDFVPHTATDLKHQFDSKIINAGKTWKLVLKKAGTYNYKCDFHPTMTGLLKVK